MADLQGLAFSISHTTRSPRAGEKDGREYHFVDRTTFLSMIDEGQFCEYADVHGNLYGTSKAAIQQQLAQGIDVILDIDVQGAAIIQNSPELDSLSVFLAPPSLTELERRLRSRGLDSEESIGSEGHRRF
jgi:guanylate kinase